MKEIKAFRLAFREEGQFVNVYWASPDTMSDAMLLASVRTNVVAVMFDDYKTLISQCVAQCCVDFLGEPHVRFEEERAPEHERAGRA